MIADRGGHRWRTLRPAAFQLDSQAEMWPAEVVVGRREPTHGHVLLELFREAVDFARLAAIVLAHRAVEAFDESVSL